jgi:hypothetical protein
VDEATELEGHPTEAGLERFRNYCGLIKVAKSGFPWEKTTKGDVASVYTNCETALVSEISCRLGGIATSCRKKAAQVAIGGAAQ